MYKTDITPMNKTEKSIFLIPVTTIVLVLLQIFHWNKCQAQESYGFLPTGKHDTVSAAILITNWDDNEIPHHSYVVNGYAVRSILTYIGDKMPIGGVDETYEQMYADRYEVKEYLDYHRKPLGSGVIVWDAKLNYKRKDQK